MRKISAARGVLIASLLLVSACGGGDDNNNDTRISTTGNVTIESPQPGSVFPAGQVPVKITLEGAKILEEAKIEVAPDEGHIHVKLDDELISLLAGLEFNLADLTETPIAPGGHLLTIEFVSGNHNPFEPREIETVVFNIR